MMICTHHYSIRQNGLTNLKILCAPEELKEFGKRVLMGAGSSGEGWGGAAAVGRRLDP